LHEERYERQIRIWGKKGQDIINKTTILLVGVGGTGCEILKNLALIGFGTIHVIDLDIIEVTNLNRQFFFQEKDVGRFKAEVAAEKARLLNPNIKIYAYNEKVQNLSVEILESCDYFISALDNISARLFLNQKAIELNKPLLDCGTEGFLGHVQVVIPRKTPCLVCQDLWVRPEMNFKCTYAINPRTPLDCALEARDKFYINNNRLPDPDNEKDLMQLLELAEKHAKKFGIIGVNTEIIKDSIKGTVESIITTNSIIGSVLVNELIKLTVLDLPISEKLGLKLITFFQFQGISEMGWTIPLERNKNCPVCGINQIEIIEDEQTPLAQLIEKINLKLNGILKFPLLIHNNIIIYREKLHWKSEHFKIKDSEVQRLKKLEITPLRDIFKIKDTFLIKDEMSGTKINIKIMLRK